MKKLLLICLGFFFFACNSDNNTETETVETNTDESVEIGSGEEVSPQLETGDTSDVLLEVDTASAIN